VWDAIQFMRCFPLLHEEANTFADQVIMIDPQNPLGIFLKGYIAVAKADLHIMAYRSGVKSSQRLEKIYSLLKASIKYYEQSTSLIQGKYNPANINILSEYANALLFIHNLGKLGKRNATQVISSPVLEKHIKHVSHMINLAAKRSNSKAIKNTIEKIDFIISESEVVSC